MGRVKQMLFDQRESDQTPQPKKSVNRVFKTIIGTHFVDFQNVNLIDLGGKPHKVIAVIVKHCVIKWSLCQSVETWGVKSIGIRPVIINIDTVAKYKLNDIDHDIDHEIETHFEFSPEMASIEIDTNEFNPLVNGIVPTAVQIKINNNDPANIIIKF